MSLSFVAIAPHPPLLHEPIGKEHMQDLSKTLEAYARLDEELYTARLDTLIVITPHGRTYPHTFELCGHPDLNVDFSDFGDLITKGTYTNDISFIALIKEKADQQNIPIRLEASPKLDYGSAIPLLKLTHAPKKIVVIRTSNLNTKAHMDMGYVIKDIAMHSNKRIGVLASADLSHHKPKNDEQECDTNIVDAISSNHLSRLMAINQKNIAQAGMCGYESLVLLTGILSRIKTTSRILAYERVWNVGYLTAYFAFHV